MTDTAEDDDKAKRLMTEQAARHKTIADTMQSVLGKSITGYKVEVAAPDISTGGVRNLLKVRLVPEKGSTLVAGEIDPKEKTATFRTLGHLVEVNERRFDDSKLDVDAKEYVAFVEKATKVLEDFDIKATSSSAPDRPRAGAAPAAAPATSPGLSTGKKVLLGLAAAVGLFLVYVATRPPTFHIERSATIAAPPAVVFAHVNDFHQWPAWNPFEKLDPSMKKTFDDGPKEGVSSGYGWEGNGNAGSGHMTITKSVKPSLIVIKLDFTKPMAASDTATFTFAQTAEGTKVTWAMDGASSFASKLMSVFMDMDKMVGSSFEDGLASLKTIAEREAATPPAPPAASTPRPE